MADCECRIFTPMLPPEGAWPKTWTPTPSIVFCPLHANAEKLKEGLTAIRNSLHRQRESGTWRSLGECWQAMDGYKVKLLADIADAVLAESEER
jgi:hypothetical protein